MSTEAAAAPHRRTLVLVVHGHQAGLIPAEPQRQAGMFNCEGLATSFRAPPADLPLPPERPRVLMPLSQAANRLSDSLAADNCVPVQVQPAPQSLPIQTSAAILLQLLLQLSGRRRFLIRSLESMP
ncbi:MAG: hypothetical protein VKI83_12385 [Synechococcaceae cyanobacterium]|nr:hypothetical protein [Synechococcaceae cyanobacterium]